MVRQRPSNARRAQNCFRKPSRTIGTRSILRLTGSMHTLISAWFSIKWAKRRGRARFHSAVQLDPLNGISSYNLGCVLEEQGDLDAAIEHLVRAARALPSHPDIHFDFALAYEKRGDRQSAREHWMLYFRYAPNGPWAGQARRA